MHGDFIPWPPAPDVSVMQALTCCDGAASLLASPVEQQLFDTDRAEHAHRSVGRLLRAGTPFTFLDNTPRRVCIENYTRLLGPYLRESEFPSYGGRYFIAGKTNKVCAYCQHTATMHFQRFVTAAQ